MQDVTATTPRQAGAGERLTTPITSRRAPVPLRLHATPKSSLPQPERPHTAITTTDNPHGVSSNYMVDTMLRSYSVRQTTGTSWPSPARSAENSTSSRQPQFIFDTMREMRERTHISPSPNEDDFDLRPEHYFVPANLKTTSVNGKTSQYSARLPGTATNTLEGGRSHSTERSTPTLTPTPTPTRRSNDARTDRHADLRIARHRIEQKPGSSVHNAIKPVAESIDKDTGYPSVARVTKPLAERESALAEKDSSPSSRLETHDDVNEELYALTPSAPVDTGEKVISRSPNPDYKSLSSTAHSALPQHISVPVLPRRRNPASDSDVRRAEGAEARMGMPYATATRPSNGTHVNSLQSTSTSSRGFLRRMFRSTSSNSNLPTPSTMDEAAAPAPQPIARAKARPHIRPDMNPNHFTSQLLQVSEARPSLDKHAQKGVLLRQWQRSNSTTGSSTSATSSRSLRDSILDTANLLGGANLAKLGATNMTSAQSGSYFRFQEGAASGRYIPPLYKAFDGQPPYLEGARDDYTRGSSIGTSEHSINRPLTAVISRLNASRKPQPTHTSPDLIRTGDFHQSPRAEPESSFLHDNSGSEGRSPVETPRLSRRHQELCRQRLEEPPTVHLGLSSPLGSHPIHSSPRSQTDSRSVTPLRTQSSASSISLTPANLEPDAVSADESWVVADASNASGTVSKGSRIWLQPMNSDEVLTESRQSLPFKTQSLVTEHWVQVSALDPHQTPLDAQKASELSSMSSAPLTRQPTSNVNGSTGSPRPPLVALNSDDGQLLMTQLGGADSTSEISRLQYMTRYNFANVDPLVGLRELCYRLPLRGEAQQVDRVLASFATRWCECNPKHAFISRDVVHAIAYSLILLNTDLHVADLESRMTRAQFLKNTLPAVKSIAESSVFFEPSAGSRRSENGASQSPREPQLGRTSMSYHGPAGHRSAMVRAPGSVRPIENYVSRPASSASTLSFPYKAPGIETNVLPNPSWELEIEGLLKDYFSSIRHQQLPVSVADIGAGKLNLGPDLGNGMKSNSSLDQYASRNTSVTNAQQEVRDESITPSGAAGIGFTGALNTALARPDTASTITSSLRSTEKIPLPGPTFKTAAEIFDEEGGHLCAPWAKEGLVKHKLIPANVEDKKGRNSDRGWSDVFAVVDKGSLRLFSFSGKSSMRKQPSKTSARAVVVGGGNWSDNAEQVGVFQLRHTLAMPWDTTGTGSYAYLDDSVAARRPGTGSYSKNRPHVFLIHLPGGARHLFSVGTVEILEEWISTCNYWAARLSSAPLSGGVSNAEYGWSDRLIGASLAWGGIGALGGSPQRPGSPGHGGKMKWAGDKAKLEDWLPPPMGGFAGQALTMEVQEQSVQSHVLELEIEQSRHAELRAPMMLAFSPRHPNLAFAIKNFENRRAYLRHEASKFRTYAAALTDARRRKEEMRLDETGKSDAVVVL